MWSPSYKTEPSQRPQSDLAQLTNKGSQSPCASKFDIICIIKTMFLSYKQVPKHCNLITNRMTLWMTNHAANLSLTHLLVAIFIWIILGRYAGFYASKWCQTLCVDYKQITSWPLQPPEALIVDNFKLFRKGEISVPNIITCCWFTIASVFIWWRMQKNKQYGKRISFFCDTVTPQLCPVMAAICIACHASFLHPNLESFLEHAIHMTKPHHSSLSWQWLLLSSSALQPKSPTTYLPSIQTQWVVYRIIILKCNLFWFAACYEMPVLAASLHLLLFSQLLDRITKEIQYQCKKWKTHQLVIKYCDWKYFDRYGKGVLCALLKLMYMDQLLNMAMSQSSKILNSFRFFFRPANLYRTHSRIKE